MPPGTGEGKHHEQPNSPRHAGPGSSRGLGGNPREHSEAAAERRDGLDLPEIRMHSQAAAEGHDE